MGEWVNTISLNTRSSDKVLLKAGAAFMVKNVVHLSGNKYKIVVEEVDPTFVEKDLEFNEWLR